MAYALVAHTIGQSVNGEIVTSPAINSTGASALLLLVASYAGAATPPVADSKGNTWSTLTSYTSPTNIRITLFYAANPAVGAGHTFSAGTGGVFAFPSVAVQAWSGALTVAPFDQQNGANTASASALATGSITPTVDNELVVAGASFASTTNTLAIDAGFTISDQAPLVGGNASGLAFAYKVQTTAAAVNPSWSWSGNDEAAVDIASFKSAGAPAIVNAGRAALLGVGQ